MPTWVNRLLKMYYRDGQIYRIPFGPMRGMRLRYDPEMNYRNILGLTDLKMLRTLSSTLDALGWDTSDKIFADLGANRGAYAFWMSRLPCARKVYAFEPAPKLAEALRTAVKLNHCDNMEIVELACADKKGEMSFFESLADAQSSLFQERSGGNQVPIRVKTTSLDEFFLGEGREAPDFIKMDIEGAGTLALPGAKQCLTKKRPVLYVESHSPEEARAIGDLLMSFDYQALQLNFPNWVVHPHLTYPYLGSVAGSMILVPSEHQTKITAALRVSDSARWQDTPPATDLSKVGVVAEATKVAKKTRNRP